MRINVLCLRLTGCLIACWLPTSSHAFTPVQDLQTTVEPGHAQRVTSVSLDGESSILMTTSDDGTAIVWDVKSGRPIQQLVPSKVPNGIECGALSLDGSVALLVERSGIGSVWNPRSGKRGATLQNEHRYFYDCKVSPDGKRGWTVDRYQATIWDLENGQPIKSIKHEFELESGFTIQCDANFEKAILPRKGSPAELTVLETRKGLLSFEDVGRFGFHAQLSGDGRRLFTHRPDSYDMPFRALFNHYDVSSEQPKLLRSKQPSASLMELLPVPGSHQTLQAGRPPIFSQTKPNFDGSKLAIAYREDAGDSHKVAVIDMATGKVDVDIACLQGEITSIAWSMDGKSLVTGAADRSAAIWNLETQKRSGLFKGRDGLFRLANSRNYDTLALLGKSFVSIIDAKLGRVVKVVRPQVPQKVTSIALSKDGSRLAMGMGNGLVEIVNARSSEHVASLKWHHEKISAVAFSPDGDKVYATAEGSNSVVGWDSESGDPVVLLEGLGNRKQSFTLSDDGSRLAAASSDNVIVWDTDSSEEVAKFPNNEDTGSLAFSRDGAFLAWGSTSGVVLFDVAANKQVFTYPVYDDPVQDVFVDLSNHGELLVVGRGPSRVVWDSKKKVKLHETQLANGRSVNSVRFSGDDKQLITVSSSQVSYEGMAGAGEVEILDLQSKKQLATVVSFDDGEEWITVTPEGYFDGSSSAARRVSFRVGETGETTSLAQYEQHFWRPGLFRDLISGKIPESVADIRRILPPSVKWSGSITSKVEYPVGPIRVEAKAISRSEHPVKSMRLLVDGRPFQGESSLVPINGPEIANANATWDIDLPSGVHQLRVIANGEYAQGSSSEVTVKIGEVKSLANQKPNLYVLSIGISQYQDPSRLLEFAHSDAIEFAAVYKQASKSLFAQIESNVITDAEATQIGCFSGLQWLRERMTASPHSIGIVFFAGHGEKSPDSKRLFFLPHDFRHNNFEASAISATTLKQQLAGIPGRLLLVLDACHSADIEQNQTRGVGELSDQLLRDLSADDSGLVVLCSALGYQKSIESRELKHGVFTHALMEALLGKANKSSDGAVYLDSVIAFTNAKVREMTDGSQIPVAARPVTIRDFPLSKP